jgi:predicted RNase H-like nuclease (RuvC/YqgF family)
VENSKSSTQKIKDLESKIKELERSVGVKQMNIDFLEKMIEIAKDEYDIDIKKNSSTLQSTGSESTKKK